MVLKSQSDSIVWRFNCTFVFPPLNRSVMLEKQKNSQVFYDPNTLVSRLPFSFMSDYYILKQSTVLIYSKYQNSQVNKMHATQIYSIFTVFQYLNFWCPMVSMLPVLTFATTITNQTYWYNGDFLNDPTLFNAFNMYSSFSWKSFTCYVTGTLRDTTFRNSGDLLIYMYQTIL